MSARNRSRRVRFFLAAYSRSEKLAWVFIGSSGSGLRVSDIVPGLGPGND
jgi:hypothetical protein